MANSSTLVVSRSTEDAIKRRAWLGLLTILGPVLLVSMDGSILFIAMPRVTSAITPTADQALWILDIYGFVVGSLLIAFGNIGDRFGRLKLIMAGALLFGVGSTGAAFSTNPESLIACRLLMGVGGATLLPSGLAIVAALFPDSRKRAQAIGIFAATFAMGFAIGPVLGGFLLQITDWWGSVFLINAPIVIGFLAVAPITLKEVRSSHYGRIDLLSLFLSFVGILLFTYSVKRAAAFGLTQEQLLYGVVGIAAVVWFIRRQRAIEDPLVDLRLFGDRVFTISILAGFLSLVVWSAAGYMTSVYLQSVLGYTVFATALLMLPGAVVITGTCILTPYIIERIGKRVGLIAVYLLIAIGVGLLLFTDVDTGVTLVVVSTIIAGVGYGISFSLVADVAVSAVPVERAGAAGAIAETSNELGNAFGISLLGSVAALVFRLYGPGLAGTLNETLDTPDIAADGIIRANEAFVFGFHIAMGIAAVIMLFVGLIAVRWLPRKLPE
ncbi:MFS transporter [Roseospira marina]|uniref:MFS transporter n=1 Tax=Roseospira marina TaxID=140057 RepID=A0A5M6I8K9_9PROT|nr:MFS transporter [Roseospira marina]KAA5604267.1 MFS transporter [Roseospira marina]MBB4315580.1 DHA2 family multidrug resistance protein-like MFS transporter [Roseospira marina]MBB5088576.1 DHA2 family multidrug resistance protein-like MFS transporter [Roseospira marina]